MPFKNLLSFSALAILAAFLLHYPSANNIINTLVQSQPDSPNYTDTVHSINRHVREMDEVVSEIVRIHARSFVDNRFTTEELATYPEVKAVVELLHESLRAVVALNSGIDLSDCRAITHSFETCNVWSTSAKTDHMTSRLFLQAIHAGVNRCAEALDKVTQQQTLLKQLTQTFVDCGGGSLLADRPSPKFSPRFSGHELQALYLSWRLRSFLKALHIPLMMLERLNDEYPLDFESLTSFRKFLVDSGENLAAVTARYDGSITEGLALSLRDCREGRSRRLY